jgi:DNA end-binding protein Ku
MPRSIWSGAISFGLVSVPVKLYSAVSPKTVRFHQLHATDGVRIQQKRVCPADGEEVPYQDIVKGYEIAPERYVVIEPEELDSLGPERTRTIDIEDFVSLSEIDPVYYDHPYYLAPGPGGAKPYRLLLEAMRASEKVAIARVVLRSKEQLVAVRPLGPVLAMTTMNFADEVVDPENLEELPDADVKTSERELDIARQLIDSLGRDFEPERYRDTYRDAVLALIERKAQGEEIALQPAAPERELQAPDLMSALQASLAEVRSRGGESGASGRKTKAKAAGATKPKAGSRAGSEAPAPPKSKAKAAAAAPTAASTKPRRAPARPRAPKS